MRRAWRNDEDRDCAVGQDLKGLTAEYDGRRSAPTVRGHHYEIASPRIGRADDGLVRLRVFEMKRLAIDPARARSCLDRFETLHRNACHALLVQLGGIRQIWRIYRGARVWSRDGHGSEPGAGRLCQSNRVLRAALRRLGTVGRNEDVREQPDLDFHRPKSFN